MPDTGSDFSAISDETALGFTLAEFQLPQPLTEGPSLELPPDDWPTFISKSLTCFVSQGLLLSAVL